MSIGCGVNKVCTTSFKSELVIIFRFFTRNAEIQKQRKEHLISLLKPKKKTSNPDNKNRVTNFVDFMKGKN
jgi:hypothetical protein